MFGPTASPVVQRQSTWHIGPTTCVFTSRSTRVARERGDRRSRRATRASRGSSPSIQRASATACSVSAQTKHDARVIRSASTWVRKPPDSAAAFAPRVIESGEAALGVRERHVDLFLGAARLDDLARVVELVRAERDDERPGDRDGDDRDTRQRLRRARERLEVDRGDDAVDADRLLAGADRFGVVLPWPARAAPSGAELMVPA